jgi:hypothetical protein
LAAFDAISSAPLELLGHFEDGRGKRNDSVDKRPDAPTFFTKSPE